MPKTASEWSSFVPTTPDEVLTKIEHLLKITTDDAKNETKNQKNQKNQKLNRSGTSRTGDRKNEKEEDKDLLKASHESDGYLVTQPPRFQGDMRDYQIEGLRWMVELFDTGLNGILADEMGLGKTLQVISLLAHLKEVRGITGTHIIIVPKSTMGNWRREFEKFYPHFNIVSFQGTQEERAELSPLLSSADVIITTYEWCMRERTRLAKIKYCYCILDEAHRIKNSQSMTAQSIRTFDAKKRLLMTGTPINNNLDELWSLLNFLKPDLFHSNEEFRLLFQDDQQQQQQQPQNNDDEEEFDEADLLKDEDSANLDGDQKEPKTPPSNSTMNDDNNNDPNNSSNGITDTQREVLHRLHRILRPFILRRLKSEVAKTLPPKIETKVFVKISKVQRMLYKNILMKDFEAINATLSTKNSQSNQAPTLNNMLMQLRKCVNHPYLFDGMEPEPFTNGPHLIKASGKMIVLDKLLTKLKAQGSRVLIFSQMTRMLDIIEDYCLMSNYKYCRIDGNTAGADREEQIEGFNAPGSDDFIFLLTTRAGGVGINLYTADAVILFDSDWNPQMDLQAMDRAHRIGQTKTVKVFRFVCQDTLEERIIDRALRKLALDVMIIQQGRLLKHQKKGPDANEMQQMIRFGADKVFRLSMEDDDSKEDDYSNVDDDIDKLLEESMKKTQLETEQIQHDLSKFSLSNIDSDIQLRNFEGELLVAQVAAPTEFSFQAPSRQETIKNQLEQRFFAQLNKILKDFKSQEKIVTKYSPDYHLILAQSELQELLRKECEYLVKLNFWKFESNQRKILLNTPVFKSLNPKPQEDFPGIGLTPAEKLRIRVLQATGFPQWKKFDVESLFAAVYTYGPNVEQLCRMIPGKTPDEVREYFKAFCERVDIGLGIPATRPHHISVTVTVPREESGVGDENMGRNEMITVKVSQEHPLTLKEIKAYIGRGRSTSLNVIRQLKFQRTLKLKFSNAIKLYQDISTGKIKTSDLMRIEQIEKNNEKNNKKIGQDSPKNRTVQNFVSKPIVNSFFDCVYLKYPVPTGRSSDESRSFPLYSQKYAKLILKMAKFVAKVSQEVLLKSKTYPQALILFKYYADHGLLEPDQPVIPTKQKKQPQKTPPTLLDIQQPLFKLLFKALSSISYHNRNVHTHKLRLTSPYNVPRQGPQWTPSQDAMLLFALFHSDLSNPNVNVARSQNRSKTDSDNEDEDDGDDENHVENLQNITGRYPKNTNPYSIISVAKTSRTITSSPASFIANTYSIDHVMSMVKKYPQNLTSAMFNLLTTSDIVERLHALVGVVESEPRAEGDLIGDDIKLYDHDTEKDSWFNLGRLSRLSYAPGQPGKPGHKKQIDDDDDDDDEIEININGKSSKRGQKDGKNESNSNLVDKDGPKPRKGRLPPGQLTKKEQQKIQSAERLAALAQKKEEAKVKKENEKADRDAASAQKKAEKEAASAQKKIEKEKKGAEKDAKENEKKKENEERRKRVESFFGKKNVKKNEKVKHDNDESGSDGDESPSSSNDTTTATNSTDSDSDNHSDDKSKKNKVKPNPKRKASSQSIEVEKNIGDKRLVSVRGRENSKH